ncbi:Asparagine-rich zinc finger protein AZF1 [Trichostrongylus colubriformis]|uniref:Asparagine-rich zinc finger protein AZF1 n=1 Tax=Trichostrongylus colubriformis TaxID=6319 RepID=A0AAN8FDK8_TRICO
MDELNACVECGFTTSNAKIFTSHIEQHEEEHNRSSSGELSHAQTIEWTESDSSTLSPISVCERRSSCVASDCNPFYEAAEEEQPATAKPSKTAHVCPHCKFTTYMSQHMRSHLDAHSRHQGQMYQCDICQMQFSQKANMHRHRMRHSGVKPYECRYCKKRFFRKDQMQEHSMTHIKTGIEFDCPVAFCARQFNQHTTLRSHLDEAHNISAMSPASCKRCSLLFANSRRLLLHYQTRHDDRECAVSVSTANGLHAKRSQFLSRCAPATCSTQEGNKKSYYHKSYSSKVPSSTVLDQHNSCPTSSEDLIIMCINSSLTQPVAPPSRAVNEGKRGLMSPDAIIECDLQSLQATDSVNAKEPMECVHCGISFFDRTIHLLHKGLHTASDPWRCNLCGTQCVEKYMFTTHVIFANHTT